MSVFVALAFAFISGFGLAALLDALYGFTTWDEHGVFLVTTLFVLFGCLAIGWVVV